MSNQIPSDATVKVCIFDAPKNGLLAEVDVSKPHVRVPHDEAVVDVSTALAFKLVFAGRAVIVEPEDEDLEEYEPEAAQAPQPAPFVPLSVQPIQKAESAPIAATPDTQDGAQAEKPAESDDGDEDQDQDAPSPLD